MFRKMSTMFFLLVAVLLTGNVLADMVLYLPFDEDQGETVFDTSDFGNDGEIHNTEWVEGKFGGALKFNGTDSYVLVPYSPCLDMTTQFTAEAWVQPFGSSGLSVGTELAT